MVKLNKIYTRTGDDGSTGLVDGSRLSKNDVRVRAYGDVDETNSVIGLVRLHLENRRLDDMLSRIQNDLFDLGADLATPLPKEGEADNEYALRMVDAQAVRLEQELDALNADLEPLTSFVLPGGSPPRRLSPPSQNRLPPRRKNLRRPRDRTPHKPRRSNLPEPPLRFSVCRRTLVQ